MGRQYFGIMQVSHLIPVPMDEPFVIPNLKAAAQVREHVETLRRLYRRLVVVMFNVMCGEDVFIQMADLDHRRRGRDRS